MPLQLNLEAYASSSEEGEADQEIHSHEKVDRSPRPTLAVAEDPLQRRYGNENASGAQGQSIAQRHPDAAVTSSVLNVGSPRSLKKSSDDILGPGKPVVVPSNGSQDDVASYQQYIQSMTLPKIASFDIPASPGGPSSSEVSDKFNRFLQLKRNGTHFNDKIEKSFALRNPTLPEATREFAGITRTEEYASTLPNDLGVPRTFPSNVHEAIRSRRPAATDNITLAASGLERSISFASSHAKSDGNGP